MSFEEAALSQTMTEGQIRADERERIAAMVEALPPVSTWTVHRTPVYRAQSPAEIAAQIRGEA